MKKRKHAHTRLLLPLLLGGVLMFISDPVAPSDFGSPVNREIFAKKVYQILVGLGLPGAGAELLTAHMAFSSGWGKGAFGYNFTGLKAGGKDLCYGGGTPPSSGDYACLCSFEYVAPGKLAAGCSDCSPKDGNPRCKYPFRYFSGLSAGLNATLSLLKSKHQPSYQALLVGDPEYFRKLKETGWYTADADKVYNGCMSRLKEVRTYLARAGMPVATFSGGIPWWVAAAGGYLLLKYFA